METNVGIRTYRQIETLAGEIDNMNRAKEKPVSNGLLSPRSKPSKEMNALEEQAAYRTANYFNTIRKKRMELISE